MYQRPMTLLELLLLVSFLAPHPAQAAPPLLGAPSYDHATETTYRQVTWNDFQGKGVSAPVEWNRWSTGSFAHIATKVEIGRVDFESRQEGEEWIVTAPNIRPYAIMNKDFSAVQPGSKDDYTLAHEQLHFDIAEIVARRLAIELPNLEGRGSTQVEAHKEHTRQLRERFEAGLEEFTRLQTAYDGESAHGMKKKKQKQWAEEVPKMFKEATEALVAMLEERNSNDDPSR